MQIKKVNGKTIFLWWEE